MKHSCNTFTQGDEKGIAGQARNDSSLRMKKINLKEISKIMSESEMKDRMIMPDDQEAIVAGGGGGGGGSGGTCGFYVERNGIIWYDCGLSQAEAKAKAGSSGYWCCDSCPSTWYCG